MMINPHRRIGQSEIKQPTISASRALTRRRLLGAGLGVGAGLVVLRPTIAHAGALQSRIDTAAPGSTLDLTGQSFAENSVVITKPLTIIGPEVTFPTTDPWGNGVAILHTNDVTLQNWVFHGGGLCVRIIESSSNVLVKGCSFQGGHSGGAIFIYGAGGSNLGSNNIRIEGCTIVNTNTFHSGYCASRGSEDSSVFNHGLEFVDNYCDQGQGDLGWFGLELKCNDDVLVTGNTFKGGPVQVSLPETNNVWIEDNEFDMTGTVSWGIEVPNADTVTVVRNICHGNGPTAGGHFISRNTASLPLVAEENTVSDIRTFMDTSGDEMTVRNNCLTIGSNPGNVQMLFEFQHAPPYANRIVENNGPGSCGSGGTPITVNDNSTGITYSGAWQYGQFGDARINGDEHYSNVTGAYAEYTFTGTKIEWIVSKHPNRGKADVYVDGVFQATVDGYATGDVYRQVLYTKSWETSGTHTIKVVCKGEKNPSATNYYATVDAFRYTT